MTMKEYYQMTILQGNELRKRVEKLGQYLREEWIGEYYRNSKVYKYENNIYYIDNILGIVDIL